MKWRIYRQGHKHLTRFSRFVLFKPAASTMQKVQCLSLKICLYTFTFCHFSLSKLLVSDDLLCSTVTNQITFDQQDSNLILKFERAMGVVVRCWFPNW